MSRNDFFLQLSIFGMTAAIFSLMVVKFYPSGLFSMQKVKAAALIDPAPNLEVKNGSAIRIKVSPNRIAIPSINVDLAVDKGVIVDNDWTLFDDKVSWLSTSEEPGFGNVIIYGHNRLNLFASLKDLKVGDEITVEQKGRKYTYMVFEKRRVVPTDVDSVVSNENRLTLYTCDGSFDTKRLVVIALPKS